MKNKIKLLIKSVFDESINTQFTKKEKLVLLVGFLLAAASLAVVLSIVAEAINFIFR